MTWLVLPWFVLVTSHSPARMTVVMIAELVGFSAAGLPSGAVLQRLGARRTMLTADAIRAPLMLLVPVLHWTGHLSFGALIALAFALGTFAAPYFSAQRVIVPELLGEDESTISQANALFQGAIRITMVLGPPIGGVLIGVLGAPSGYSSMRLPMPSRSGSCSSSCRVGRRSRPRRAHAACSPASASCSASRCYASGSRSSSRATQPGRRSSPQCRCSWSSASARTRRSPAFSSPALAPAR
jgi:hypothetical protein